MNIDLHIERLVLDALPMSSVEVDAVRQHLSTHLASLLVSTPLHPSAGFALSKLSAANIAWNSATPAADTGQLIAQSVHQAIVTAATFSGSMS